MIDNNLFRTSEADHALIMKLVSRYRETFPEVDTMHMAMNITAVHTTICKLDLKELVGTELVWFLHDMVGIEKNLNKKTIKLDNQFLPRCLDISAVINDAFKIDGA